MCSTIRMKNNYKRINILSENDIIILECPRSGKTTLTNMIIKKEQDYQVISLDSLMIAIKQIFLELEINNKSKISEISKKIIPFLSIYLKNFKSNYPKSKIIIEEFQILLEDIMENPDFNKSTIIGLGFTDISKDEIYDNIRKEDRNLINSYTKKMDDNVLKSRITFSTRYSYHLNGICKKYNIPFFDTGINRSQKLNEIIYKIIKQIKIKENEYYEK